MDTELTITQLGEVLAQLEATPHNLSLIKQQISLTEQLDMFGETMAAISSLAQLVMLDTGERHCDNTNASYMASLL